MTVINFERNDCQKIHSRLDAYLDGELTREMLQETFEHLEHCQGCALELAAREQLKRALHQAVKKDIAPFGLEQRIQKQLRKQRADSPVKFSRWVLAVAATLILGVIGLGVFKAIQYHRNSAAIEQAKVEDIAVLQVGLGNHMHCAIDKDFANKQFTEDEMKSKLGEFAGLVAELQTKIPTSYRVVVGHRCKFNDRQFVHLILKDNQKVISVTLTQKENEAFSTNTLAAIRQAAGIDIHQARLSEYEVSGFEHNGYLGFVTSNLEKGENLQLAANLAPVIQDFLANLKA